MAEVQFSQFKIYVFMILMVISGSINTIANKFQQNLESLGSFYSHPWFITTCMFIGETTCLIWYSLLLYRQKKVHEDDERLVSTDDEKPEISIFLLAIPALCDFLASTLMCLGLTMMASSVYQMLRGSVIIFTAVASIFFLKRILYRHNFLGIGLIVGGLLLVGAGAFWELGNGKGAKNEPLGFILVIIAQLFSAAMFICEEKLLKSYKCHPLKLVGFEGMWGTIIYSILMIIFKFSSCPFDDPKLRDKVCVFNGQEWLIEDVVFAFRQLGNNGLLLFFAILYTLSISLFNYIGINITKQVSAAARAVVDTIRTVIVWLFFLTLPFVPEPSKEKFSWLQLSGFLVLLTGTLIYNEVFVLRCGGFNLYTKKALKYKEEAEKKVKIDNTMVTVKNSDN
jgi:drug/metabolite transporter (DMT)-like permease